MPVPMAGQSPSTLTETQGWVLPDFTERTVGPSLVQEQGVATVSTLAPGAHKLGHFKFLLFKNKDYGKIE